MIYYVTYYVPFEENDKRRSNYAAEDKVDYICDAINYHGESITVLSNAKSKNKKFNSFKSYSKSSNKKIVMFSSMPNINNITRIVDSIWGNIQLFTYLLLKIKKDDAVVVYHSLGYRSLFNILSSIKNFKYILEVEELYQYIEGANRNKNKEYKVFKQPDAFIFSNSNINRLINNDNKPNIIINGKYVVEKDKLSNKECRSITRVVYAGSLEKQKGVDYVIEAGRYLDSSFEIKIIGFGNNVDIDRVKKSTEKINGLCGCQISYDGVYKGDEYRDYLQNCDIGICIQDPDDNFNYYEYPSKIFSYLSNGLKVVVNDMSQVIESDIAPYLNIACGLSAQTIAAKIIETVNNPPISMDIINKLDMSFKRDLITLIKGE